MMLSRMSIEYRLNRLQEKVWMWLAWHLPRTLVYWCAVRLMAHATTGKYGETIVPDLTCLQALNRWDK